MSDVVWLGVLAAITLALAVYAHARIPSHTPTARQAMFTRVLLLGVGLAFGWVIAAIYGRAGGLHWWLIFLSGFGVVHVPAAAILFLKKQRRVHG